MELQFKQIERMTQQDADRLELKKRKADREERLIDTEMQAKRLQTTESDTGIAVMEGRDKNHNGN